MIEVVKATTALIDGGDEHRGNETDRLALLAIKTALVHDPEMVLSTWNQSLHHCLWEGVTCGRKHNRVTVLDLHSRSLGGTISPFTGNLSFLRALRLYNNSLHGQIPSEIVRLFRLQTLILSNNTLGGEIPANLSSCINLEKLNIGFNNLEGRLPPMGLGTLSKLTWLVVQANNFVGPLFEAIANITSLEFIAATQNGFTGTIPYTTIARMTNLRELELGENQLHGLIPPSLFNLSSLEVLELSYNQLQGSLPSDINIRLPQLTFLNLAMNHLSGPLPLSISNLTNLEDLLLGQNNFTGSLLLLDFRHHNNLRELNLFSNQLRGDISFVISSLVNSTQLGVLNLEENEFTGILPPSVANLSTQLTWLLIGKNRISGEIPAGISNLINLEKLGMDGCEFTGTIPHGIGMLQRVEIMSFRSNRLTGGIPSSFGNLSRLSILDLSENRLQGSIPSSLGGCQNLLQLYLFQNKFNGTLPKELFGGSAKFVVIYLSQNNLQGYLPSEINNQINLATLDVSENRLSGQIPNGLASCSALQFLYMEDNSFDGNVPPSFSSLRSLQEIDLSHNNLSGPIPDYFSGFPLGYLNLSNNNFEGRVPTNGVFANESAVFLTGNSRLCGGIPRLHLPRCMEKEREKKRRVPHALKFIIPTICGLIGLAMAASLYFTCPMKRRASVSSGPTMKEQFLQVSYNLLLKATDGFSLENLLGAGNFGSVFKGVLEANGETVAVKVLNLQQPGAAKSFMAECEALRNIRHRNLVGIITACSSVDFQSNDFKALVYEFMPNGNLHRWLHEVGNLSLLQRVDIAMDVACALNYLHHDCEAPIVHCDLKPGNILLDSDMVAHVGDFGLAKFLAQPPNPGQSSSIGVRGTVGYAAPEYGLGSEASAEGDLYSYGIVLLELMTGKRPTNDMFTEDFNLHMYAKAALPDHVLHIVDPVLKDNVENEPASNRRSIQDTLQQREECMVSVVKLGVGCSNQSTQDRMKITDAISELRRAREIIFNARRGRNLQRGG